MPVGYMLGRGVASSKETVRTNGYDAEGLFETGAMEVETMVAEGTER